jgi:hypothetical protein
MPKRPLTNKEAEEKLNSMNLKYNFNEFEYNNNRLNKSVVYCPEHGRFKTTYHYIIKSHNGLICKKCRNEHQQKILLKQYHGKDYIPDDITTKQYRFWTKERCRKEASNYKTKRLFTENSKIAAKIAIRNNWLDEICVYTLKNKKSGRHKGISTFKWNKILCQEEASKYQTKRDFKAGNRNAYEYAYRHGFLNEISQHMMALGNKRHKCVYCYEFSDNSVYVGITCDFNRRKSDRESRQYDTVTQHINQT